MSRYARQSPLGASQQKKPFKNTLHISQYHKFHKKIHTFLAKSQYNLYDECCRQCTGNETENETVDTKRHGCDEVTYESTPLSIRTIQQSSIPINSQLMRSKQQKQTEGHVG